MDSLDVNGNKLQKKVGHREACCAAVHGVTGVRQELMTEQQQHSCSMSVMVYETKTFNWKILSSSAKPRPGHWAIRQMAPCALAQVQSSLPLQI